MREMTSEDFAALEALIAMRDGLPNTMPCPHCDAHVEYDELHAGMAGLATITIHHADGCRRPR